MIAIVDYGVGNLFSLKSSFAAIGQDVTVTSDKNVLDRADRIVLPGVGAFEDAAKKLYDAGLAEYLQKEAEKGKMLMGICLGMQLLFEKSYEYGCHEGLSLLKGSVVPIKNVVPDSYKIPHIGWNALHKTREHPLLKNVNEGDCVYFVHSYFASDCGDSVIATTEYGGILTAAVAKDNVMGCQFHPEKSGRVGLSILKAFSELSEDELC